jgi:hypothetical protein
VPICSSRSRSDRSQTKGFEVVGYVARLDRDPQQDAAGDVVILPTVAVQDSGCFDAYPEAIGLLGA